MTVLDVGANVGQMTLELATLVGPSGRVLAIEPGRGTLELLRLHLRENRLTDRVEVVEAACADMHGGEVEFFVAGESAESVGSGHTMAGVDAIHRGAPEMAVHRVRCARVSIDGLCSERNLRPDVIKIDVEGAELHVLRGARQTLSSARPRVRVGFHPFAFEDPAAASDELRRYFADLGYRIENAPSTGPLALEEYVAVPER
jgi:FkbM family methyltransferase